MQFSEYSIYKEQRTDTQLAYTKLCKLRKLLAAYRFLKIFI